MNDKYLITGATGFVGSSLVRELVGRGKDVVVLVRDKRLNWRLADIADSITIYETNLLDESVSKIFQKVKPSYIFHLAVYGALPGQVSIDQLIDTNLKGTVNVLQAAKQNKFKLFVNTGSSSEYGLSSRPMKESDLLQPVNDYGITKSACTLYCQKEATRYNLPVITFRLFSPYGEYEMQDRLVAYIILNMLAGKTLKVSKPNNVRDFIYIKDVIRAYLLAAEQSFPEGEVYNIGSGMQHSVKDVIAAVSSIVNKRASIEWNKVSREVQVEPEVWRANISKIKKQSGWKPEFSLLEGLSETVRWFEKNKSLYGI